MIAVVVVFHWLQDYSLPSAFSSASKVDWVYFARGDNIALDVNVELKTRDHPNLACKDRSRQ